MRLHTRAVRDPCDVRDFFDSLAGRYCESHGPARRLLERRLTLIRRLIGMHARGVLLDLGCGPGVHLFPLASDFARAIGVDLSPRMIAAAAATSSMCGREARVELHAADATHLSCIAPDSVDVVLCVGALEHMHSQAAVLAEVVRGLKAGGRFVCLTVNGAHLWYRHIAPQLGYDAKHLSTDRFLDANAMRALLQHVQLRVLELGYWDFIAKGDMPPWIAWPLQLLQYAARMCAPATLRGGMYVCAEKPRNDAAAAPVERDQQC